MNHLFNGTKIANAWTKLTTKQKTLLLIEVQHDFDYYDANSNTYEYYHQNTPVAL
jgi:hypothetical protein